jgi:hypothetical protein
MIFFYRRRHAKNHPVFDSVDILSACSSGDPGDFIGFVVSGKLEVKTDRV